MKTNYMANVDQIVYHSCYWQQGLSIYIYKACALNLELAYWFVGCSKYVPSNKGTSLIRVLSM